MLARVCQSVSVEQLKRFLINLGGLHTSSVERNGDNATIKRHAPLSDRAMRKPTIGSAERMRDNKHKRIQLRLKKPVNTKLIASHWDTIQRIMISLYERKTTQAILVRKLSGYKNSHPLLAALTEYNRMVKANYLLNYIDDVSLRDYVQKALNRGEAYHQLSRAISNVNGDQFRGSSDEEIQLWNECARLVTNAIIYFNSAILSQLLTSFEYQMDEEKIQIVKQASPVAWYNINLKGTYNFQRSEKLPDLDELMSSIEGYIPVQEKYPPRET
jgi:hypothetical protein